jgi:ubiquinone/menaquinone biosynthesis C-methylase UbiE
MKQQRIPETDQGITGEIEVQDYDQMQRSMRDKGLIETKDLIRFGINDGTALEIGPGPGYLGLEWLKNTKDTKLHWLEISEDMKKIALGNAKEYGLENRITATISDATKRFPFDDNVFDAVFTNGSMHEWVNPVQVFSEVHRVLKKGGRFFISDLKRNINPMILLIMKMMVKIKKKSMKQGLMTSIWAAYIKKELEDILPGSALHDYSVKENPFGLIISGIKDR